MNHPANGFKQSRAITSVMDHQWVKKTVIYVITIFIVTYVSYLLPKLLPGDAIQSFYGNSDVTISAAHEELLREKYADQLSISFSDYIRQLLRLDFGYSFAFRSTVASLILDSLSWTLLLVGVSQLLAILFGFFLGVESAYHRATLLDKSLAGIMSVLQGIPQICTGILLLYLFAYKLSIFPVAGALTAYSYTTFFGKAADILSHSVLVFITLILAFAPDTFFLVRNSMVIIIKEDYITTARAKGLKNMRIKYVHAVRNALLPFITQMGLRLAFIFTCTIVVEKIFSYPGVGSLLYEAIGNRDLPVIRSIVLIISLLAVSINFLLEILYRFVDPRITHDGLAGT